jgi:hypothetical protein
MYTILTSPQFRKPIKAIVIHILPDKPAEDTSNNLENLDFNVINARQMTANRITFNKLSI